MPQVNKSALVPYSAEQMFKLVENVDAYKEFLPWCGDSKKVSEEGNTIVGTVTISKGSLHKAFTTRNTLVANEKIEIQLVDGPFKELTGFWRFTKLKDNACKVSLELDYEFSSRLLAMVVGPIFTQVANAMVDSFVKRAKQVY